MKNGKKTGAANGLLLGAGAAALFVAGGVNYRIQISHYPLLCRNLPAAFDRFRIVHLSDLHGACFGPRQAHLVHAVKHLRPHLILLTGDLISRNHRNTRQLEPLLAGIAGLAPIYSVNGNHELDNLAVYGQVLELFRRYGVRELADAGAVLKRDGGSIHLWGIDASHNAALRHGRPFPLPPSPCGGFGILMFHGTDRFGSIAMRDTGYSLLFAGHSHGGIVRLPHIGPLISNDHRLFPKYAGGVFHENGMILVGSRGLGNWIRLYNRPEVVCAELRSLATGI